MVRDGNRASTDLGHGMEHGKKNSLHSWCKKSLVPHRSYVVWSLIYWSSSRMVACRPSCHPFCGTQHWVRTWTAAKQCCTRKFLLREFFSSNTARTYPYMRVELFSKLVPALIWSFSPHCMKTFLWSSWKLLLLSVSNYKSLWFFCLSILLCI
jgi:hypothetical protein